jgi:hypothetical protein
VASSEGWQTTIFILLMLSSIISSVVGKIVSNTDAPDLLIKHREAEYKFSELSKVMKLGMVQLTNSESSSNSLKELLDDAMETFTKLKFGRPVVPDKIYQETLKLKRFKYLAESAYSNDDNKESGNVNVAALSIVPAPKVRQKEHKVKKHEHHHNHNHAHHHHEEPTTTTINNNDENNSKDEEEEDTAKLIAKNQKQRMQQYDHVNNDDNKIKGAHVLNIKKMEMAIATMTNTHIFRPQQPPPQPQLPNAFINTSPTNAPLTSHSSSSYSPMLAPSMVEKKLSLLKLQGIDTRR